MYMFPNLCSYVQNTGIRVLPESICRCRNLQMLYTAALRAKSKATPAFSPEHPSLRCVPVGLPLTAGDRSA